MKVAMLLVALVALAQNTLAFKAMGYYFEPESLTGLTNEIHRLDEVMFDLYNIDNKGNVRGKLDQTAMATAKSNNKTKVYLTISNYGPNDFNAPRVRAFLRSNTYKNRLIKQLMTIVRTKPYDGVNIDFEAIPPSERGRMTAFIKTLSARLHAAGKLLAISVPAVEEDNPSDSWAGAFNYKVLGQAVDIMQVMTYDQHGPWDARNPGPVAGLDWVKRCIDFMVTIVPPEKVSVGIPAYGYLFNPSANTGETIAWKDFPALIAGKTVVWDDETSSPYVEWTQGGKQMVAWLESVQSIRLKAQYVRSIPNIHGVSVWALAHEDSSFWDALLNV